MIRSMSIGAALVVLVPTLTFAQNAPRPVVRDYAAELSCAPEAALTEPSRAIRIAGGPEANRHLFSLGDAVIINAGTTQGLKPGQVYRVRRLIADRFIVPVSGGTHPQSIHTVGWLRIADAQSDVAHGTVTRVCDTVETGDFLEPLVLPAVPPDVRPGEPDYSTPAHLILGDERRQMGGTGAVMVLDRGSDHGVKAGQRMTIFRRTLSGTGPVSPIGEATALVVSPETTVIRIDSSLDAIYVGDLVALHR